ncbi:helix-turn-helix transcriptional regulator [Xanthobacter sp. DSM 24535]|uniref:helix-turn-helix domain-containing protein n=1 Tax=Roseixanthobacter psychrophilus TaxID=3119917 RepID=UPI003728632B
MSRDKIAERLRMVRDNSRLSQRALATRLGIAYRTWQDIENGKHVPSGETLLKIAELGINPGWVLLGTGPMRSDDFTGASELPSGGQAAPQSLDTELLKLALELVDVWLLQNRRTLAPEKKANIVTMIYQFAAEDRARGKEPIDSHRVAQFLRLVA